LFFCFIQLLGKNKKETLLKVGIMVMPAEYLEVLETVYEMAAGNENKPVGEQLVGEQLGQQLDETKRIVNWLVDKGFLKRGFYRQCGANS
jgi:hypothetical protein